MADSPYSVFSLHSATGLHKTDTSYSFGLAWDNDDMFCIKRRGGGGNTEVHILDAARQYGAFSLHAETGLHETDENWEFLIAPNRDLVCINRKGGSGKTEVHILSAASTYKTFTLHAATALHETLPKLWSFSMAENRDLFCVASPAHGGGAISVVVLTAASSYSEFGTRVNGGPADAGSNWIWQVGRSNRDMFGVKMSGGANCTEVHVWGEQSNYKDPVLHSTSALHPTDAHGYSFTFSKTRDLFIFKRDGGSNSTEIHTLAALSFGWCPPDAPAEEPLPVCEEPPVEVQKASDNPQSQVAPKPSPVAKGTREIQLGWTKSVPDVKMARRKIKFPGGWTWGPGQVYKREKRIYAVCVVRDFTNIDWAGMGKRIIGSALAAAASAGLMVLCTGGPGAFEVFCKVFEETLIKSFKEEGRKLFEQMKPQIRTKNWHGKWKKA